MKQKQNRAEIKRAVSRYFISRHKSMIYQDQENNGKNKAASKGKVKNSNIYLSLYPYQNCTVKLANCASPFKFRQTNKLVLRMKKCVFPQHCQLNSVSLFEINILSFSILACCGNMTWWSLKGLAWRN